MKLFYENPELEIVEFEVEDIITTSAEFTRPDPTGDEPDETMDDSVPGVTDEPDEPDTDVTEAPGEDADPTQEPDPTDPSVEEPDPTEPDPTENTTLPPMQNGGEGGAGAGDSIDYGDLFG